MKRGMALTCALMIVMMNTPAASAERNIVSTIRGADYAISVDADVYGEGTSGLQAYRMQTLDWGRNPETHFDLSLWFDADVPTEKADFGDTVFYPKGDETRLGERDEARFSPYGVSFMRATDARLTFPLDKWNYRRMQENPNAVQLPQGFALTDAAESILPIAQALGVEVERRPVFVSVMTLADWQAETRQKLDRGVAPDERVIEDWTADDESVQLNFRQLFHGLPMLETDAHMPGILEWETSLTMVSTTVSRRGLERLFRSSRVRKKPSVRRFPRFRPKKRWRRVKKRIWVWTAGRISVFRALNWAISCWRKTSREPKSTRVPRG